MMKYMVLIAAVSIFPAQAQPPSSGTWHLDEARSEVLDDVARKFNDELNEQRRKRKKQTFDRERRPKSRNRFQNQADATEEMIREDSRSTDWGGPEHVRNLLEASRIKLYVSSKVVVLYDDKLKRLLVTNPAGRAFSLSGTELTVDDYGRTLTFFDDEALYIETEMHEGGKFIERYSVESQSAELVQHLTLQERSGGPKMELTRYFIAAQ